MSKFNPVMKSYSYTDYCGNVFTLTVREGRVLMANQNRIACCLSNVGFMTAGNGTEEKAALVRAAAIGGLRSLRAVTKLDWKEI